MEVIVVGGGIFGITGAMALAARGDRVTLVDPGPPHPDAASTDISKLVRMDYGADVETTELAEEAIRGWERWNARWARPLYHPDGMLVLAAGPLERGTFEGDSYRTLSDRGWALDRLDARALAVLGPAWRGFDHGYRNARGGWVESGAVVGSLVAEATGLGRIRLVRERVRGLLGTDRVDGVALAHDSLGADMVVLACGAWTATLLPELADRLAVVGQPVLHFAPQDPSAWAAPRFLPWAADIANTGFYGFPANEAGIVKVANHGPGILADPSDPRVLDPAWDERFRVFLRRHLPGLAEAPLAGRRMCLYCDSFDGHFLIDRHPTREGLTVAAGGSGHAFKFAPVLGRLIADAVHGQIGPAGRRYRWRSLGRRAREDARLDGEPS